jgi:hypothetical protein
MSDPREEQRTRAIRELFVARGEFAAAFQAVPDEALGFKDGSGYSLSGIVVHLTATIDHYRRVIEGLIDSGFKAFALQPQDPGVEAAHATRVQTGFSSGERDQAFALLESANDDFVTAALSLVPSDYVRNVPVTYKPGEAPHDTSPSDVVRWLTDHYREHSPQVAGMAKAAAAQKS